MNSEHQAMTLRKWGRACQCKRGSVRLWTALNPRRASAQQVRFLLGSTLTLCSVLHHLSRKEIHSGLDSFSLSQLSTCPIEEGRIVALTLEPWYRW